MVAVEPVFGSAEAFRAPSENSGVAHSAVAEGNAEKIQSSPRLHCFRGRFLTVAVVVSCVAESSGIRVSGPWIECAQEWEPAVVAVPVGVVLGYHGQDFTV